MKDSLTNNDGVAATLPTAQELALKRNPVDPAPYTSAVFKAIRESKPLPKETLVNGHSVEITAQTIDTLAFLAAPDLVEDATISKLRELQARMVAIHDKVSEFSPGKVTAFIFNKRDEIHAAMQAGKEAGEIPSREHVQQNFDIRRAGLMNQLVSITQNEVIPLCRPILEKFSAALETSMRDMEEPDRELCVAYGLSYEPAYLWRAACVVASRFTSRRLPGPQGWALPSHVLENLVTLD